MDNDAKTVESDKSKVASRLQDISDEIKIIDHIKEIGTDIFILSIESVKYSNSIAALLKEEMNGEINPHQYSVEETKYKMTIANWPHTPERTTLSIRRYALKKIGKALFFRGFLKMLVTIVGSYISFLLWSINT